MASNPRPRPPIPTITIAPSTPGGGGRGGGTPDNGSVTDASIAAPGLSQDSIVDLVADLAAIYTHTNGVIAAADALVLNSTPTGNQAGLLAFFM